jgi:16S rRNA pseudouridine516 synthase
VESEFKSKANRLDRLLRRQLGMSSREVRESVAQGRILIDEKKATGISQVVDEFSKIQLDERVIQCAQARYIMMNKPKGVVSATKDLKHTTVIDLIESQLREGLHLPGRLDFNTTGLILLTNNGAWSRRQSQPESKVSKGYRVTLTDDVDERYVEAFSKGIHFSYEDIVTQPAQLKMITSRIVELSLQEGRYHQVKRMFGYFQNEVIDLHRLAIGGLVLDVDLALGEYRMLTEAEVDAVFL